MRIVSLLPSATEILFALGLGDDVVGVTHECDEPPVAATRTHVTRNLLPPGLTSAEIDRAVVESSHAAHSIYELDIPQLVALRPDLILTQDLCQVCAVPRSQVDEAVAQLDPPPQVLSLDPNTLDDVLADMERVGQAAGCAAQAASVVAELRARIDAVRTALADVPPRPRVFCCEWFDPIYCAGHWVPEQVRLAGGDDALGREARPSIAIPWEDVVAYQPEVLVLMPCGYNAHEAAARIDELAQRPGWSALPAVRAGQVFAVHASAYFSRPGPRLVDGLELLARILHPERWSKPAPPDAALRLVPDGGAPPRFEPYR